MNEELSGINWPEIVGNGPVDEMWTGFRDLLLTLVDRHIPLYTEVKKRKTRTISKETIKEMKARNESWRDYRRWPTDDKLRRYKQIRNRVNKMVRDDHSAQRSKTIESFKGRPKKFFSYIRQLQMVKDRVVQLKRRDGSLTANDAEAAEELCLVFKDVFTMEGSFDAPQKDLSGAPTPKEAGQKDKSPADVQFDEKAVRERLLRLDPDKSPGPDGLHPHLLKACADNLAKPIAMIFQKSFDTAELPVDWKLANVCPIFKKGSRNDAGNYRPVSLTSVLCKIMEAIVKDRLMEFVEESNIISNAQHGFRKGKSCLTNLLESFEKWTEALDNGYGIDVIYLDYRKAFDTVPHQRLLLKLRSFGISEKYVKWIASFLQGRRMRVGVRGQYSGWSDVVSGVPQGSVLGLLLFLLYVNDLPDWIVNSMRMFADDTKV